MSVAARLARIKAQRSAPAPAASSPAWPDVPAATPAEVWHAKPLRGHAVAVIDCETTGVDPATARIVEVAVVLIDALAESEPRVVLSTRVNPGEPIPEAATRVHGISDADVAGAPTWAEVQPQLAALCMGPLSCAYNAPYDHQVIAAECARAGLDGPQWRGAGWLDPLVLVRLVDQYEAGKQLRQMAQRRGVTVEAHGAAGDAMTVAMLLPTLLGEAPRLVRHGRAVEGRPLGRDLQTVGAYLAWQRATALAQERELVEYLARAGRRDPVTCPWHELEGLPAPEAPRPQPKTTKCKSCGAPVLWAVTSAGKKIPLDPTEIRASAEGPGRLVSLVVEGWVVAQLREDPAGDVLGRESHFATCPNAAQHRKPAAPAPTDTDTDTTPPPATSLVTVPVTVVVPPLGPRCTVQLDDGRIIDGHRVPDDYAGPEVRFTGRCVRAVWWDAHAPVSDDRGRRLPQPAEGGGVTWHAPPNPHPPGHPQAERLVVEPAEPPPLPRTP